MTTNEIKLNHKLVYDVVDTKTDTIVDGGKALHATKAEAMRNSLNKMTSTRYIVQGYQKPMRVKK